MSWNLHQKLQVRRVQCLSPRLLGSVKPSCSCGLYVVLGAKVPKCSKSCIPFWRMGPLGAKDQLIVGISRTCLTDIKVSRFPSKELTSTPALTCYKNASHCHTKSGVKCVKLPTQEFGRLWFVITSPNSCAQCEDELKQSRHGFLASVLF